MEIAFDDDTEVSEKQSEQMNALIEVGELMPIVYKRQENLRVCVAGDEFQSGDLVTVALHSPHGPAVEVLEKDVESVVA